jgi:hypothetical protein
MKKMDETAEDPCDPAAIVNAFLQHKCMKQTQDYMARSRRFAKLDVGRLNKDWIIAELACSQAWHKRTNDG